ncbi:putative ribonuclease H-like domain-containing protein [Tanacetum coccineum]
MRPFGCPVTILNTIDHLGKFDGKADEGFFVGYSLNSKAFRVFNSRTRIVEENFHIRFSKSTPNVVGSGRDWLFDIDALTRTINYEPIVAGTQSNGFSGTKASNNAGQAIKESESVKNYILLPLWTADPLYPQDLKSSHDDGSKPSSDDGKKVDEKPRKDSECKDQEKKDNVNNTNNVNTTGNVNTVSLTVNVAGTNKINVVSVKTSIELPFDPNMPALEDDNIFDFSRDDEDDGAVADINNLDTTIQVSPNPTTKIHKDHPLDQVIRDLLSATQTRKMSKNLTTQKGNSGIKGSKLDRGYAGRASTIQQDYEEVLRPVARIEAIRLFLAYASFKDFVVYQIDVKSAFLYEKTEEVVYVCQPPGFEDPNFPDRVYKVEKALPYSLEGTKMSFIGELTFFLGLQVQQKKDGIFISQDKYVNEILKKFRFTEVKTESTPMEIQKPLLKDEDGEEVDVHMYRLMIGSLMYLTSSRPDIMFAMYLKGQPKLGLWYPKDSPFDLVAYTDSDYAGASLDRKSTTRGCQFLGCRLISWQCKKLTVVANSITEAEYVAASRKAKKSVRLMMGKLFGMKLELMMFWSIVKAKTINGEEKLHALVDDKKIIITESSVRRDLQLADEEGVDCLPNSTIFEQLTLMGPKTTAWNEFSSTMASAIIYLATNQKFNFSKFIFESMIRNLDNLSGKFLMYPRFVQIFLDQQLDGMSTHKRIYIAPSHTKKIFGYMRRVGKGFSGRVTPLFQTMVVQNQSQLGEGSAIPTDPHHTPTFIQPSTQPQKTQQPRKPKRKDTQVPQPSDPIESVADEVVHKELGDSLVRVATTASSLEAEHDSGNINKTQSKATPNESSSQGTNLGGGPWCQETIGDTIAQIRFKSVSKHSNDSLLARGNTLRSDEDRLKLDEIDARIESSDNEESLGEDASKQGRIDAIDEDEEINLVSVHDVNVSAGEEVFATTVDDITLALVLEEMKSTKTKKKGDKGKGILIEPMKPMKKKDLIVYEGNGFKFTAGFNEEKDLQERKWKKKKKPLLPD